MCYLEKCNFNSIILCCMWLTKWLRDVNGMFHVLCLTPVGTQAWYMHVWRHTLTPAISIINMAAPSTWPALYAQKRTPRTSRSSWKFTVSMRSIEFSRSDSVYSICSVDMLLEQRQNISGIESRQKIVERFLDAKSMRMYEEMGVDEAKDICQNMRVLAENRRFSKFLFNVRKCFLIFVLF